MKAQTSRQPILQMMLGSKPTLPVSFICLDRTLPFRAPKPRRSLQYHHHNLTDQAFTGATTSFPSVLQQVLQLYPDDPSQGSPYDPTNTTTSYRFYGGTNQYKRLSSLMGDLLFQSGELLVPVPRVFALLSYYPSDSLASYVSSVAWTPYLRCDREESPAASVHCSKLELPCVFLPLCNKYARFEPNHGCSAWE